MQPGVGPTARSPRAPEAEGAPPPAALPVCRGQRPGSTFWWQNLKGVKLFLWVLAQRPSLVPEGDRRAACRFPSP